MQNRLGLAGMSLEVPRTFLWSFGMLWNVVSSPWIVFAVLAVTPLSFGVNLLYFLQVSEGSSSCQISENLQSVSTVLQFQHVQVIWIPQGLRSWL